MKALVLSICLVTLSSCFFNVDRSGARLGSEELLGRIIMQDMHQGGEKDTFVLAGFAKSENTLSAMARGIGTSANLRSIRRGTRTEQCDLFPVSRHTTRALELLSVGDLQYGEEKSEDLISLTLQKDNSYFEVLQDTYSTSNKKFLTPGTETAARFGLLTSIPDELTGVLANGLEVDTGSLISINNTNSFKVEWDELNSVSKYNIMGVEIDVEKDKKVYRLSCLVLEKDLASAGGKTSWQIAAEDMQKLPISTKASLLVFRAHSFVYRTTGYKEIGLEAFRSWLNAASVGTY